MQARCNAVTDKDGKPAPDVVVLVRSSIKPAASPSTRPAAPVVITQEGSRFVPFLTVVPVGSTDARGMAVLDNVPDGPVELTLWHPDQLQEQAPVATQVSATSKASAALNFVPRTRR